MDCPICKKSQLEDGAVQCPECNSDLGSLLLIDEIANKHGNLRKAGFLLAILLLIAIGALATSYANRSNSQADSLTSVEEPTEATDDKDAKINELAIQVEEQQMEIDRLNGEIEEIAASANSKRAASAKGEQLHVVQPGESLWTISKKYYGKGSRHNEIANNNDLAEIHSQT